MTAEPFQLGQVRETLFAQEGLTFARRKPEDGARTVEDDVDGAVGPGLHVAHPARVLEDGFDVENPVFVDREELHLFVLKGAHE